MAARLSARLLRQSSILSHASAPRTAARQFQQSRTFSKTPALCETVIKRFTEDHEWISVDTETKIGTIGLTEYAQKSLGDVVFVELPTVGTEVAAGESIGAVESVKSASDIMTPISGTVTEANSNLESSPDLINKSAEEGKGWIAKIEVTEEGLTELEGLMGSEEYVKFTTSADEDH